MTSLPYPADTPSRCTAPHVDGCPECVVNVEQPLNLIRTRKGCTGYYLCSDCGYAWETSFGRCG